MPTIGLIKHCFFPHENGLLFFNFEDNLSKESCILESVFLKNMHNANRKMLSNLSKKDGYYNSCKYVYYGTAWWAIFVIVFLKYFILFWPPFGGQFQLRLCNIIIKVKYQITNQMIYQSNFTQDLSRHIIMFHASFWRSKN